MGFRPFPIAILNYHSLDKTMIVPFETLPENARIWIFPSSRLLDKAEQELLLESASAFLQEWTAHNQSLTASAKMEDGIFLVVAVDERQAGASGCSIDKLHRFVKEAESKFAIRLMERLNVVFPGNPVSMVHFSKIQDMIKAGELDSERLVYDTTVTDLGGFIRHFRAPMRQTWLNRFLHNA